MNEIRHPQKGQSFAQSGTDTPSSQGSGGQQSGSHSTSTSPSDTPLATPSFHASAPSSTSSPDIFERLTDPLQALSRMQEDGRRNDLESATRITHSTGGPSGPLGLSVSHQDQVSSHLSPVYARLGGQIAGPEHANVGVTLERNAATLSATSNVSHGAVTAGASNIAGFYNGQMNFTSTAGTNMGGLIGATKQGLVGAGFNTMNAVTTSLGVGGSVLALINPNASKTVTALDGNGHANLEHKQTNYLGGQAVVSIGVPQAGVAMRIYSGGTVVRAKEEQVTTQQAKAALEENSFLSRRAIGIGLKPAFPGRHGIDYAQDLAKGETSFEQRTSNLTRSVAVSGAGVHFGKHVVKNSGSQVRLGRSNSGSRKSMNFAETQSSTSAYTIDLPVFASVTKSTFSETSSQVLVELSEQQDASQMIRRSKSILGLSQALNMSMDLRGEDLAEAKTPSEAILKIREKNIHPGINIQQVSHSTRQQLSNTRGSLMPLIPTVFGARASSNMEGGVAHVRRYTANLDSAEFIEGRERSVRKEFWKSGVQEESASYLHVNSVQFSTAPQTGVELATENQETYLTATSSFLQCDFSGLNKLNEWTEQFKDGARTAPSSPPLNSVDPFSATAHVTVRLGADDKLKLLQKGLFQSLRAPLNRNDATQRQKVVAAFDRELTKSVETDMKVVRTVAQMLGSPAQVQVNVEVDLLDRLAQEVNQISVQSSPNLSSSPLQARRRLATLALLKDKANAIKKMFNHPLFAFTPEKQAEMKHRFNSVEAQLKKVASVMNQQDDRAQKPQLSVQPPLVRSRTSLSSRVTDASAAAAAAALAAPDEGQSGDLGLIPLQSLSKR